jgi:hypothetical protein
VKACYLEWHLFGGVLFSIFHDMRQGRTVPLTLDWVTERAKCSLTAIFLALKEGVKRDVDAQNDLNGHPQLNYRDQDDRLQVYKRDGSGLESVAFALRSNKIEVLDTNGALIFEATITLNDLGECKLRVQNQERELWQVRRQALEQLFFGPSNLLPHS